MAVKVVLTILRKLYQVFRRMIQNVELNIKCKSKNLKTIKKLPYTSSLSSCGFHGRSMQFQC